MALPYVDVNNGVPIVRAVFGYFCGINIPLECVLADTEIKRPEGLPKEARSRLVTRAVQMHPLCSEVPTFDL